MQDPDPPRLRQSPEIRFAGPLHPFNLDEVAARLKREHPASAAGHRQEMLYKHGPFSIALFLFQPLTRLPPHRAKGLVTIHVLHGCLRVMAQGTTHDLHAGNLLVLAPGVEHDVAAQEESQMLLTLCLETPATMPAP